MLVCGQGDTDGASEVLARVSGTVVVRHRYDGQVVVRSVTTTSGSTRAAGTDDVGGRAD